MPNPMTIEDFGKTIKAKYPEYKDVPDIDLGNKMLEKYPEYKSSVIQAQKEPVQPTQSLGSKILGGVGEGAIGALKGLGSSLATGLEFGLKGADVLAGVQKPQAEVAKELRASLFKPQGKAQEIGFAGEQLAEYLIPGMGAEKAGLGAAKLATQAPKFIQKIAPVLGRAGAEALGGVGIAKSQGASTEEAGKMGALLGAGSIGITAAGAGLKAAGTRLAPIKNIFTGGVESVTPALEKELLLANAADSRVASKMLKEGSIVKDPIAKEVIRQGIPEADVALIKSSSSADKQKMLKMLDIREAQKTNKRVIERATDVVGDTFIKKLASPIEKLNKSAGVKLNIEAKSLAGKPVNVTEPLNKFISDLADAGVTVKGKTLSFKGSAFEGLKGPEQLIKNVWLRANRVARTGDALDAHRMKKYIDEIVNYGKQTEGLSGNAEGILKGLRGGVDEVLDTNFPKYNAANTQFRETIMALDKMGAAIGKSFKINDTFADAKSGLAMRKILSNRASRTEVLSLLDDLQKIGKKYGVKIDEDIISQANFADLLETLFGSEAPTSLLGQLEKVGSVAGDVARGSYIQAGLKAGKGIIDATRNITEAEKLKALRALLKRIK